MDVHTDDESRMEFKVFIPWEEHHLLPWGDWGVHEAKTKMAAFGLRKCCCGRWKFRWALRLIFHEYFSMLIKRLEDAESMDFGLHVNTFLSYNWTHEIHTQMHTNVDFICENDAGKWVIYCRCGVKHQSIIHSWYLNTYWWFNTIMYLSTYLPLSNLLVKISTHMMYVNDRECSNAFLT